MRKRAEVKKKITFGESKLVDPPASRTSGIWRKFRQVVGKVGEYINYVQWNDCEEVYSYNGNKTGPSHILRHKCVADNSPVVYQDKLIPMHVAD